VLPADSRDRRKGGSAVARLNRKETGRSVLNTEKRGKRIFIEK